MGAGDTSVDLRGAHKVGGAPSTLVGSPGLPWRALQAHQVGFLPKLTSSIDFFSVLTPSDIPFPRNTEIGIKQQIWVGPPVNRSVPKII